MTTANRFLNPSCIWYYALRWLLLIFLGLAIYAQTFNFGFVFDDYDLIVNNPYIKNLSNLHYMWSYVVKTRLIGILSFALNYHFNQLHPEGYHIVNFLIHLLTVGMVWATSSLLFKIIGWPPSDNKIHRELPYIIALFFLVHPGQTQAITYIAQRMESLTALFYLIAIYSYLRARSTTLYRSKLLFFALSSMSALLGIFTKETAVTIPLMILACELILWPNDLKDFIILKKNSLRKDQRKIYLLTMVASLFFFILFMKLVKTDLRIFLQTVSSDSHDSDILSPVNYFLTQMRVFLTFLNLLILPIQQNLDYDYPMSRGLLQPPLTLIGMCVIGFIIALIFKLHKKQPLITLGLAWILITFTINMAPRRNLIFEHKLYLISFGFFLALVITLFNIIRNRILLLSIFAVLIVTYSVTSYYRNQVWQNQITLWEDVVEKSPNKARGIANLARAYCSFNQFDKALPLFNKAISIKPSDYLLYVSRASTYSQMGLTDQAYQDLKKVIKMQPNSCSAHMQLSQLYENKKKHKEALEEINTGINLDPSYPEGYIIRAHLFLEQGNPNDALKDLQKAVEIDPYNIAALGMSAQIHLKKNQYKLAINEFNKIIIINPKDPSSYKMRAFCLVKNRNLIKAYNDILTVLRLDPNNKETRREYSNFLNNEAGASFNKGQLELAINELNQAISIDPLNALLSKNRGDIFIKIGKIKEAIRDLGSYLQSNPNDADVRLSYERILVLK